MSLVGLKSNLTTGKRITLKPTKGLGSGRLTLGKRGVKKDSAGYVSHEPGPGIEFVGTKW